jgi:hypothetical protein
MKIFISLLLLVLSITSQAQYKNAISINVSYPSIQLLLKASTDSTNASIPTNINYSHIFKHKWMMRIGFGGYTNYQIASTDLTADKVIQNYKKLTAALAVYHCSNTDNEKFVIGKGFSMNGIFNKNQRFFDSGFDLVEFYNQAMGAGIGPSFFAQYSITKSLAVYTEYSMLYNIYNTNNGKNFSAFPNQNYSTKKIINHGLQFQYPVSLYLSWMF